MHSELNNKSLNKLDNIHFTPIAFRYKSIHGELVYIGEGVNGEYDYKDSTDHPLLRLELFSVDSDSETSNPLIGGSCCTQLSVYEDLSTIETFLKKTVIKTFELIASDMEGEVKKLVENACFQPQSFISEMG